MDEHREVYGEGSSAALSAPAAMLSGEGLLGYPILFSNYRWHQF